MIDARNPLVKAAARLSAEVEPLVFASPVEVVYNPLVYAWKAHAAYLSHWGRGRKRVLFLGMNPGPWGMAQTGVPFGEVSQVRDWVGVAEEIGRPDPEHPKRPIEGFSCMRSEVSGQRLWGLFAERFGKATVFFRDHFVANYCPLVFMAESGRNLTPDKLPVKERRPLEEHCDAHLQAVVEALKPEWVIGIGKFAESRAKLALEGMEGFGIGTVFHPSPASPAANRGWAEQATRQLEALGVWGAGWRKNGKVNPRR